MVARTPFSTWVGAGGYPPPALTCLAVPAVPNVFLGYFAGFFARSLGLRRARGGLAVSSEDADGLIVANFSRCPACGC